MLPKDKPSAFFGTPLVAYLNELGVDTVTYVAPRRVVAYARPLWMASHTTIGSKCPRSVRSIAVASHAVSLFDIDMKYGDVTKLAETLAYLGGTGGT